MNRKRSMGFAGAAVALACAFAITLGAAPAWASVEEDQTSLTSEQIAAAIAAGEVKTVDDQNVSATPFSSDASLSAARVQGDVMQAFSGADRYETSALQATTGWESSQIAILVGGGDESWPDALAASGLAGALDCPILLTPQDGLAPSTCEALASLGVTQAIVVGGLPSVGEEVEEGLEDAGIAFERVFGADRYETQTEIFAYGLARGLWQSGDIAIASGVSFADALSFSPVAFARAIPVFLTNDAGELSADQESVLRESASAVSLSRVIALGAADRVTADAKSFLQGICQLSTGSAEPVVSHAGATRYETSVLIAKWAVSEGVLSWSGAAFTTGEKPLDALGGGALQGRAGSVLLLAYDGADNPAIESLADAQGSGTAISSVRIFGGKPSVTGAVRMDLADALGIPYARIPGLKVYIDAGHGWDSSDNGMMDLGSSGCGWYEWDLTSDFARRVADVLRTQYGMEVYLNDDGGWYKLRQAEAVELGCDLLVSIHFNAFYGMAYGTESYIHSYAANWKSADLQAKVHPALVNAIGLYDRGMKKDELAVCGSLLPATLLEICFIDSQSDMDRFLANRDGVAAGIAAGIAS